MLNYVVGRAVQSLFALMILLVIVFSMSRLTGDPTDLFLPLSATAEVRKQFAEERGFNDPLHVQFIRYVGDLAHGDFGKSVYQSRPALEVALEAFPVTLRLAASAMIIAIGLALLLGALAAYRPNSLFDRIVSLCTIATAAAPDFWIAIVGIIIFSMTLGWLPTSGMGGIWHWMLPVGVLVLRPLGMLTQVVRTSMIGALNSPFVKTAMSKGASRARIIFVHALRNSLLPVITVAGIQATGLINGAVVVETIFGWPGIGQLMINSIQNRDFSVTIACIMLAAIVVYAMNVIIDILYSRLDPRVRTG